MIQYICWEAGLGIAFSAYTLTSALARVNRSLLHRVSAHGFSTSWDPGWSNIEAYRTAVYRRTLDPMCVLCPAFTGDYRCIRDLPPHDGPAPGQYM